MTEHFGGYLPVVVDVTDALNWEADNVIAVWADSNDPSYPPAKHRMYWIMLILAASIVTAG